MSPADCRSLACCAGQLACSIGCKQRRRWADARAALARPPPWFAACGCRQRRRLACAVGSLGSSCALQVHACQHHHPADCLPSQLPPAPSANERLVACRCCRSPPTLAACSAAPAAVQSTMFWDSKDGHIVAALCAYVGMAISLLHVS